MTVIAGNCQRGERHGSLAQQIKRAAGNDEEMNVRILDQPLKQAARCRAGARSHAIQEEEERQMALPAWGRVGFRSAGDAAGVSICLTQGPIAGAGEQAEESGARGRSAGLQASHAYILFFRQSIRGGAGQRALAGAALTEEGHEP